MIQSGFRQVNKCIFSKGNILQHLRTCACMKEKRVIESKYTYTIIYLQLSNLQLSLYPCPEVSVDGGSVVLKLLHSGTVLQSLNPHQKALIPSETWSGSSPLEPPQSS